MAFREVQNGVVWDGSVGLVGYTRAPGHVAAGLERLWRRKLQFAFAAHRPARAQHPLEGSGHC